MSTYCHAMQDLLDTYKGTMPDGVYQQLIEAVGDEAQRGLKLVSYLVITSHKDGMSTDKFTTVCKPMGPTPYCLPYLLKRGEYNPTWLEGELPLTDSMDECATYVVYKIEDLQVMPKRRRIEASVPPPTPTVEADEETVASGTLTVEADEETVDLSAARHGGREWNAWAPDALASSEGLMHREVYAEGGVEGAMLDTKVLDRLSAFCEKCMENYVPGEGYVLGFQGGLLIACDRNGVTRSESCRMVCQECLPADHPNPSWAN